jgi:hypothetical protein
VKNHIFIFSFLALFSFGFAQEKNFSIVDYWKAYKDKNDGYAQVFYLGYIEGVIDMTLAIKFKRVAPASVGSSMSQVGWIVGKYLDEHPEFWQKSNISLVIDALVAVKYLESPK